jgi:hypothetical protein
VSARKRLLVAVFVVVVVLPALFIHRHTKSWENSAAAYTSWHAGGGTGQLLVRVRDRGGRPVAGAEVSLLNNSGGDGGTTDAGGVALIYPGEGDIERMSVNGQRVIDRPYAYHLGTPVMSREGLIVDVVLKQ